MMSCPTTNRFTAFFVMHAAQKANMWKCRHVHRSAFKGLNMRNKKEQLNKTHYEKKSPLLRNCNLFRTIY